MYVKQKDMKSSIDKTEKKYTLFSCLVQQQQGQVTNKKLFKQTFLNHIFKISMAKNFDICSKYRILNKSFFLEELS